MATPSIPLRLSLATLRRLCQTTAARPFTKAARASPASPQTPAPSPRPSLPSHPPNRSSSTTTTTTTTNQAHQHRLLHLTPTPARQRRTPLAHNREPVPDQAPPTDLGQLDVLGSVAVPTTAVDVSHADGFSLNSGVEIRGGTGALLVAGEAFAWRPWLLGAAAAGAGAGKGARKEGGRLLNEKGQWEVGEEAWAVLAAVWPRPG